MRSHLFSYRTQKLSSSAQMVLGWTRPGRVCRRRFPKQKAHTTVWAFCFAIWRQTQFAVSGQGAERTADCCYMSHTTTHYFRPAKAWEREGVTPSHRGVKMSEQRDSSCGTRSGANAFAFSRREKEHIARRRARSAFCGERRRKAQCVTRTRARESMSTPVSKTKAPNISWVLLF